MPTFRFWFRFIHLLAGTSGFAWGSRFTSSALSVLASRRLPRSLPVSWAPVSAIIHRHGFRILRYLDDWLLLASTFQESVRERDFLLWLCQRLGIRVHLPKSSLTPMQTQDYLEITIQAIPLRVFPTLKRIQKLSLLLQDFLSTLSHPVSVWRQLLGIMSSMSALVPGSRLRIRLNVAGRLQPDNFQVEWDSDCRPDLLWWSDVSHLQIVMPLGESLPDLCLFTDASDTGWGSSLGDVHLAGSWSPLSSRFSINHRELLAVLLALQGFLPSLRGRVVAVFSDNTTALAYLKEQGGTRSATLNTVARSLLRFCEDSNSAAFSVHPRQDECPRRLSESQESGHRFRMDPLCGGISSSSLPLAGHHRPLCNLPQSLVACLFLSDGGPSVSGHGRHASELGRPSGLCLPSFRSPFSGSGEGPAVQRVGADVNNSVLATASLVSGPSGASGGDSLLPAMTEGSSRTAPLPSLLSEPSRASADCLAYLQ